MTLLSAEGQIIPVKQLACYHITVCNPGISCVSWHQILQYERKGADLYGVDRETFPPWTNKRGWLGVRCKKKELQGYQYAHCSVITLFGGEFFLILDCNYMALNCVIVWWRNLNWSSEVGPSMVREHYKNNRKIYTELTVGEQVLMIGHGLSW